MHTSAPSWAFDDRRVRTVFAGAATLIGLGTILTRDEPAVDLPLVLSTVAVLWLWATLESFPRWPLLLLSFTTPLVLNIIENDDEISMFFVILAVTILAIYEENRAVVVGVIVFVSLLTLVLGLTAISGLGLPNWLLGIAFAWGAGETVYRFRHTVDELQHARALVGDQAAVHERRRIARDVHDLVGHSLSVVMLHVSGARLLVRKDPDEAERALEQAEEAARQSLADIRRTVGLLRDDNDPGETALPSADLSDVAALVDDFLMVGLDIDLSMTGPIDQVEPATALAGYRIAQEALTNVSRHTVGADVDVSIAVTSELCEVCVRNSGGQAVPGAQGSGFGLVSMRERARSVGGSLIAGPAGNGWIVEATLPSKLEESS